MRIPGGHMFEGDHAWTVLDIELVDNNLFVRVACPCGAWKMVEARELE